MERWERKGSEFIDLPVRDICSQDVQSSPDTVAASIDPRLGEKTMTPRLSGVNENENENEIGPSKGRDESAYEQSSNDIVRGVVKPVWVTVAFAKKHV